MDFNLTRGDTHAFKFQRKSQDGAVLSDTPANFWFTVKALANSSIVLIQKRLSNGSIIHDGEYYHFTLLPADTDMLEIEQTYRYDIEVKTATAGIRTIAKGCLTITEEVTHAADEVMDDG